jgi:hypothetical protein
MRHIKIYEDYTDEELKNLVGDLHGIGVSPLQFELYFSEDPDSQKQSRKEEDYAKKWTSELNKVYVSKVEGQIMDGDHEWIEVTMSNGDFVEYYQFDRYSETKVKIDGREFPEYAEKMVNVGWNGKGYLQNLMEIYNDHIEKGWN